MNIIAIDKVTKYYEVLKDGTILSYRNRGIIKQTLDRKGYAYVDLWIPKKTRIYISRLVAEMYVGSTNGRFVHHKDNNPLNNWYENLELVTQSHNNLEKPRRKGIFSSKYKGVCKHQGKWLARCKFKYIGVFKTEDEAAKAYNLVAALYGAKNFLNEVKS